MLTKANNIRANCIKMSYKSKEGHLGSALSCVDILVALYERFNLNPVDPNRDRLFFSKGHACAALYATMAEYGYIDESELETYAQPGSRLLPHPDKLAFPLVEMSAGSLGHGLGIACGVAYALQQRGSKARCIVLMGDGECNEGSVWEAAQFAHAHKLDNLLVVVDYNRVQSIGKTDEISGGTSLTMKFRAFGWHANVLKIYNAANLDSYFREDVMIGNPSILVVHTGPGVTLMQQDWMSCLWHYKTPSEAEMNIMLMELEW